MLDFSCVKVLKHYLCLASYKTRLSMSHLRGGSTFGPEACMLLENLNRYVQNCQYRAKYKSEYVSRMNEEIKKCLNVDKYHKH